MPILGTIGWFFRGRREFTNTGFETAAATFNPEDLKQDISRRSFLVTGANSGIGYATALALAQHGAGAVHLVCRSAERGTQARDEIASKSANPNVQLHVVDMSDAQAVHDFATKLVEENTAINVLINNAGCMVHKKELSKQGVEMNFACNSLGVYVLTTTLLPLLAKQQDPRVITVSSGGMYLEALDAEDMMLEKRPFKGELVYEQQKRQQVVMMEMLAHTHPAIRFYTMHPGWADTEAVRQALPGFYKYMKAKLRSPEQAADTVVWLAMAPAIPATDNGAFFQDRKAVNKHIWLAGTERPLADQEQFMRNIDELARKVLSGSA